MSQSRTFPGINALGEAVVPRSRDEARQLVIFSLFGVLLGIIGAAIAWLLYHLINIFTGLAFYQALTTRSPLYPPSDGRLGLWVIAIPVVGALIIGLMAKYGTDRIRGHGIPEAMEAVLQNQSRISPRVAIFKPISAAIAVGTGGPFGAEGPVIQTGGAIGSLLGQTMKMSANERRILLACGGAAGMVGIFNTPIAAVALALELLLFEFRARSLVPVILASAVAAACRSVLLGNSVMFNLGFLPSIGGPLDLLWFVPLGIIIGVCSVVISKALYVIEEFFDNLKIDLVFKPALGALVLGIVAFFQPRVLGMGYLVITDILKNHFDNTTLIGLALGKSVALVFSLGAGTSGGLLAPMLLIGAAIGSGYGRGVQTIFPHAGINPSICGIVAMSSLFSAAARAPLTSFVFAFELTGDYKAILPLMIGCMIADIVARTLSQESVMTERLARRGFRVDQGYETPLLNGINVGQVMTHAVDTLLSTMPLRAAIEAILGEPMLLSLSQMTQRSSARVAVAPARNGLTDNGASDHTRIPHAAQMLKSNATAVDSMNSAGAHQRWAFPLLDAQGRLVGIVTRNELLEMANHPEALDAPVSALATKRIVVAYPDESLDEVLTRMIAGEYQVLPVVERAKPDKVIGVLSQSDILSAWRLRNQDETTRERHLRLPQRRKMQTAEVSEHIEDVLARNERAPVTITTEPDGALPAKPIGVAPEDTSGSLLAETVDTLTPNGNAPSDAQDAERGDMADSGARKPHHS